MKTMMIFLFLWTGNRSAGMSFSTHSRQEVNTKPGCISGHHQGYKKMERGKCSSPSSASWFPILSSDFVALVFIAHHSFKWCQKSSKLTHRASLSLRNVVVKFHKLPHMSQISGHVLLPSLHFQLTFLHLLLTSLQLLSWCCSYEKPRMGMGWSNSIACVDRRGWP